MLDNKKTNDPQEKLKVAKKIADKANTEDFFASLEGVIIRFFRWTSSTIDKLFFTKNYAIVFALVLAILSYFV